MVKGVPQHLIDAGNANRVIRAKRAERKKTMVTPCRKGFFGQVTLHFPIVWHGQSWVGFDILLLRYGCFVNYHRCWSPMHSKNYISKVLLLVFILRLKSSRFWIVYSCTPYPLSGNLMQYILEVQEFSWKYAGRDELKFKHQPPRWDKKPGNG